MVLPATREATFPYAEGYTWYRVTGALDSGPTPLVVLHGGPGAPHNYLLALTELAGRTGRAVVHYDQYGCGRSTHAREAPDDTWTVPFFLAELRTLLDALDLTDRHMILGQSWGGVLGAEYAVTRPAGLRGLVLADSPASIPTWRAEADRLRSELPPGVDDILRRHEAAGSTDSEEYHRAEPVYYDRHVCRVLPNPPELVDTDRQLAEDPTVYQTMNGPSEFSGGGTMADWSIVDRLPRINVSTLVISGVYDEATPLCVKPLLDHIPDVRWELFEHSSHLPHVEEPERYLRVLDAFLTATDTTETQTAAGTPPIQRAPGAGQYEQRHPPPDDSRHRSPAANHDQATAGRPGHPRRPDRRGMLEHRAADAGNRPRLGTPCQLEPDRRSDTRCQR